MTPDVWSAAPGTHAAQFCDAEATRHRAIAAFLAEGLRHDRPVLMIARRPESEAVLPQLPIRAGGGVDHRVTWVDADEGLAGFMDGAHPDLERFGQTFTALLGELRRRHGAGPMWIYGEMGGLLCEAGNHAAAVRIEQHWNTHLASPDFAVLCRYGLEDFCNDADPGGFQAICREHTHVVPALDVTGRPTVYVIDDDTSVRRSMARLIASLGLPVQTFASAEAFFALVGRTAPGCVLLDVQLMGMSGADLQTRMAGARWTIPVIAMSGSHDPTLEEDALRLGARTFLRKPFKVDALIQAIGRAMK